MTQVVIRHEAGSRENQVDEFPLESVLRLSFGRDPSCDVAYDPERDDLVSRAQARLERSAENEQRFVLTDLDSANGTFLNGTRIHGSVDVTVGDLVAFGENGPAFRFDLDPRPEWAIKATRIGTPLKATRLGRASADPGGAPTAPSASDAPTARPLGGVSGIGRATVERLLDIQWRDQRRNLIGVACGFLALVALVGGVVIFQSGRSQDAVARELAAQSEQIAAVSAARPMSPREITDAYAESVVFIEFAWKLVHTGTGKQVFHRHINGVPAYLALGDTVEPWLVLDDENNTNRPIGVSGASGTGFVVTENGFVLTNRHVAANWHTRYTLPLPGVLFGLQQNGPPRELGKIGEEVRNRIDFVPSKAKLLGGEALSGKNIEGRLDYLDVTFRRNKLRIPARLVRVSDTADVALIKVDLPASVSKVRTFDNYDEIRAGDPVTVLGYPGMSPGVIVATQSQDPFNRERTFKVVPEPTVSSGNIGKVLRGSSQVADQLNLQYFTQYGDAYQLTVNSTGAGNSGGPVFDGQGRVIGIFTSGMPQISFAVPIRYGLDLMDVRKVM